MNCLNCGNINDPNTISCTQCGNPIQTFNPVPEAPVVEPIPQTPPMMTSPMPNAYPNPGVKSGFDFAAMFAFVLALLMRPVTAFKEGLDKHDNIKFAGVLALVTAGIFTVVRLLSAIYNVVYVPKSSGGWWSEPEPAKWVWDNAKELKFLDIIFNNFITFAVIMAAIAGVYYVASKIIKKEVSFNKLLIVAAISLIPVLTMFFVLMPILGLILSEESLMTIRIMIVLMTSGIVYSFVVLMQGLNEVMKYEDNNLKAYVNTISVTILIAGGFLYMLERLMSIIDGFF